MRMVTGLACVVVSAGVASAAEITFVVAVPDETPASGPVHIAGDFQGWNPGSSAHALARQTDGRWSITLDLEPGAIQYKFARGNWGAVEKGPSGEELPNRVLSVGSEDATLELTVERWADLAPSSVTGDVRTITVPGFLSGRRVWVYLPPGYDSTDARYPVLYMHDGQNLFDAGTSFSGEWGLDEALESLIASGEIAPVVAVGIDNGGGARINEYTPWPDPGFGGGGGDAYLQAVKSVLIPAIDAAYRTRTGPEHTFVGGSSLGGLISTYAGYAHPDAFGRVMALSSSYWWNNAATIPFVEQTGRPATLDRFYQDHGTAEPGIANLRAVRDAAVAQGFGLGDDLASIEAAGHQHNEFYWAQRLPDALRFVIGPPQAECPADVNGDGQATPADFTAWLAVFNNQGNASSDALDRADVDGDGSVSPADFTAWLAAFNAGC